MAKKICYPSPPLSAADHPACGLALFALHLELPGRRGTPRRAGTRHFLRNRPVLGAEIRPDNCATATPSPSAAEHSLAPRRDGNPDCWRADVPPAGRRPRGRGPRHAGPAPTRQPGGAEADAQASQEARISAEVAGHRQAALLRVGVPAIRAELPSRTGDQAQQSSRELSSAGATARAQGAAIQVASLRAALPEYACRRPQYL